MTWQPIESAPTDRDSTGLTPTVIIACPAVNGSGWAVGEGYWRTMSENPGWVFSIDPNVEHPYAQPTHWMPLPPPPEGQQ